MHEAIARMLSKYECEGLNDYINALREILQEVALLGLWRSKFFEKGAFYGGTALRILYGLDRFSEDIDFSLLEPLDAFELTSYTTFLQKEIKGFGFGLLGNIVIGIVGAFVASLVLPSVGIAFGSGIIAAIIHATIGAVILLFLVKMIKKA